MSGPYRPIRRIASGGMAEVLLAERGGQRVALKRLLPSLANEPRAASLFEREAQILLSLDHPSIVRGIEYASPVLVMEYISRAPCDVLDAARVIAIGSELSSALASVHARGWVHRDVSPENVLFDESGRAKLIDFGLAWSPHDDRGLVAGTGVALGTAAYIAPEQLRGDPIDGRADVFSLAVILHELARGERLFKRASEAATLLAVADDPIPPPGVSPAFDALLLGALSRDPGDRPTALELQRDLAAL